MRRSSLVAAAVFLLLCLGSGPALATIGIPPDLLVSAIAHAPATDVPTVPAAGTAAAATGIENPQRQETLLLAITDVFSNGDGTVTAAGRLRAAAGTVATSPEVTVSVNYGANGSAVASLRRNTAKEWIWTAVLADVVAGDTVTAAFSINQVVPLTVSGSTTSVTTSTGRTTATSTRPTSDPSTGTQTSGTTSVSGPTSTSDRTSTSTSFTPTSTRTENTTTNEPGQLGGGNSSGGGGLSNTGFAVWGVLIAGLTLLALGVAVSRVRRARR